MNNGDDLFNNEPNIFAPSSNTGNNNNNNPYVTSSSSSSTNNNVNMFGNNDDNTNNNAETSSNNNNSKPRFMNENTNNDAPSQQQQPPQQQPSFNLQTLTETRQKLFSILESQAGIMSFLLYLIFAFIVTGSTDWMVSFGCFALSVRMAVHFVVVIFAFRHSDILVSALGIITIVICLPFTSDTAAAGVWSYLLLVLPFYSEQALKNQAVQEALEHSGSTIALWRKRAVQVTQVFAPIAAGFYPFFSLQGGFFFHAVYLIVAFVFTASIVLRALELKKMNDSASSSGNNKDQKEQQSSSENNSNNNNNNNVQVLDGGIVISPSHDAVNDGAAILVRNLRQRKTDLETTLSQNNPAVYQYYLQLPRSYTTAICTFLIFLMIVVNVSTYTPNVNDAVAAPNNTNAVNTAAPGSSASAVPSTMTPVRNEGGHANAHKSTDKTPLTKNYPDHYYVAVGLVSSFLMAAIERLVDAFLPQTKEANEVDNSSSASKKAKNNNNNNQSKKDDDNNNSNGSPAAAAENNKESNEDDDDEKCCEMPEVFHTISQNLRYRRFALLGFSFIISFFPVSWKLYPAALAMASYVPWIVWRDSCGKFISTLIKVQNGEAEQGNAEEDRSIPTNDDDNQQQNNNNDNNNRSSGSENENNNNNSSSNGVRFPTINIDELINERVIADFLLPSIITALLLLLATGAEDKDPNNFLSFIAIIAHAAMAYFLYFSLKQNLTKDEKNDDDENNTSRDGNEAAARAEANFGH